MLEVDKGVSRPQPVPQFAARHEFARPLQKGRQQVKRLILEVQPDAGLSQLAGADVQLEGIEPDEMGSRNRGLNHSRPSGTCFRAV
jgi:hypothetical protein